ncbi:siphovirus ReqiPepy6 Gp37-like family protein [Halalkalibacter krulwichiae]|uniref:Gp28/Gp37-like domain-containing protein n=1 Tax=Halalkalibacter krulwichiae TaxID=199441 RepID=A0A1X9MEE6_9BACI|nr:siphovirus ReqiPepy6 Gp37-like family protein [Halalkalibacter krulwichiae]ARK28802.1 hypothetical protein BkAM31D_02460 [Halalkalibacter krulwichiae]
MQSIKILSNEFEPLFDTTDYVSMMFTERWHGVGEFQLVIHREANGVEYIQKDALIALASNKVGIVKHREIQLDENGKETENWLFKGWTLKGLALQRITVPPSHTAYDRRSADAETVMKHYVLNNLVSPEDPRRAMNNVVIAANQQRGQSISWQSRFKNLAEELEAISLASGLGWDIVLDTSNNQFLLDVYEGKNLSVDNQDGHSPVFFSPEFGNLRSQGFVDSDLDYRNIGYVGGQGEGVEREIIELGEAAGINRYEVFIDARDIGGEDEEGNEITPEEEKAMLSDRGQQKLDEMQNEMYLEAQIMSPVSQTVYEHEFIGYASPYQPLYDRKKKTELFGPFVYEKDYNLGDIVTVMNRAWGVIADQRITEITEIHEASGFQLEATFGLARPTLISKLKRQFSQMEGEVKR